MGMLLCKSNHISEYKLSVYLAHKKNNNYFFYFTHSFLQNTSISLSILHIYSIKYLFFYNFILFPHSIPLSLIDLTLPTITPHPVTIITHLTTSIKESQPIQFSHINPFTRKPTQSSQINPSTRKPTDQTTRNKGKPNHHPPNSKPIDQTTRNKGRVRWSERLCGDWREINGCGNRRGFVAIGERSVAVARDQGWQAV